MKFVTFNIFGRRIYQYVAAITGTLSILSSEMHFGWSSPSIPVLTNGNYEIQITQEEVPWLASSILIGTVAGAALTAAFADKLGRKKLILSTAPPLFISWILIATAKSSIVFYLARILAGVANGLSFSTVPMYLGEISEPKIRGLLSSLCPVSVVAGLLLINILGNFIRLNITAYIAAIFPLIFFVTFIWMPESPVYLLRIGRTEEARTTLQKLRGQEHGEKEYMRLTESAIHSEQKTSLINFFKKRNNWKTALWGLGLRSVQQFCGPIALIFFGKTIFEQSKNFLSPDIGTVVYFSLQLLVSILSCFIVDMTGRKPLLYFSLAGTSLSLLIIAGYLYLTTTKHLPENSCITVTALFFHIIFFSVGARNIPLLMMSEIFPPDVKSVGMCIATIYYSILALVITKLFYISSTYIGMYCPFFVFGVLTGLSLIFVYYSVPETRGKTLEEINKEMSGSD